MHEQPAKEARGRIMQKFKVLGAVFLTVAFSGTFAVAQASSTKKVAEEKDWSVFVDENPKECWAVSKPKETLNTLNGRPVKARRGDILLFVFYRPDSKVVDQITFTGGYPFAKKMVELDVDGKKFALSRIKDEWAWADTSKDDQKILAALKRGGKAKVTGHSTRGKTTIDTFSLLGLTAATDEARKRCKE